MGGGRIKITLEQASVATADELGDFYARNHYLEPQRSSVLCPSKSGKQARQPNR